MGLPGHQPWRLWHEDDSLLVVEKPAGLLSVPGRGEAARECLSARVQVRWPDALVVHRLDMATSGLMLFARGPHAQRLLSAAFAERRVGKRYVAVVHGRMEPDEGEINAPLAADWPRRPRQRVDAVHGRPSLTRWRVLARDEAAVRTRVALTPVSGRAHQLRLHLQTIGHPIVGDALYGDDGEREPRLLLHAAGLSFEHPGDGTHRVFDSPVPF